MKGERMLFVCVCMCVWNELWPTLMLAFEKLSETSSWLIDIHLKTYKNNFNWLEQLQHLDYIFFSYNKEPIFWALFTGPPLIQWLIPVINSLWGCLLVLLCLCSASIWYKSSSPHLENVVFLLGDGDPGPLLPHVASD